MQSPIVVLVGAALIFLAPAARAQPSPASTLVQAVRKDYAEHLDELFRSFHAHPELSLQEKKTAARLARELRAAGFEVTEGVGETGVVALLENGPGPKVLMRADMDGLPVEERSGLPYASEATQKDPDGVVRPVMHACGHDVHMTSLVGTARYMAKHRDDWSGTLMLIGQPAEERFGGAAIMRRDGLYERFGRPDFALAFHVNAQMAAGKVHAAETAAYAGVDSVDLTLFGVGAHGAAPHAGKDPVVLGAQMVMGFQTLVSRTLSPRVPGVVTVGSFHVGTKHNIIADQGKMQITVRSDDPETRATLLDGIRRVAEGTARAFGLPDDKMPKVEVTETYPPTRNDPALVRRLKKAWRAKLGDDTVTDFKSLTMGAEDFPFLVVDLESLEPIIPSVYFSVGGTPEDALATAASHHSPLFRIEPEPSVTVGTEATVVALLELLPARSGSSTDGR